MTSARAALFEIQYLPPIAFFSMLIDKEKLIVEKFEHYQKQSYRNRCRINTAHGSIDLTIPLTDKHGKVLITDVKIDYTQKWVMNHWRTIQSAYGNAPFFEFYADDLEKILFRKIPFLFDFNRALLTMCLKWLRYNIVVEETSEYTKQPPETIADFRSVLNPKKADSCNRFYKSVEYPQVFGSMFVNNTSIIDLVFCMGPQSMSIVRASAVK